MSFKNDWCWRQLRSRVLTRLILAGVFVAIGGCASAPPAAMSSSEYIPGASYDLLMAEIALQRGAFQVTAEEYQKATQLSADPELARRATEFAYDYNYDGLALAGARRWLELAPDELRANELAGRLYLRRNEIESALIHWRRSLGGRDLSDQAYRMLGADLAEEGNPRGATTILARLVNERPDAVGLRLALANAALFSGANELALDSAQRVIAAEPDLVQSHIIRARALLSAGNENAAFNSFDVILESGSVLPIELAYVQMLAAVGRVNEAENRLLELGKRYGVQPGFVRLHGMIAFADQDYATARRDFDQLLANGDRIYESRFMLGRIKLMQGDYSAAINALERVRGDGYFVRAQLAISLAYDRAGDMDAALEQLEEFARQYPRLAADVVGARAELLYRMGRVDAALATYVEALRFRPADLSLLLAYGTMLDLDGRVDEALVPMRQAAKMAPLNSEALNTLGYTLANHTDSYTEAYRFIRAAVELNPDSPAIIDSLGWVLYRLGRLEESRIHLERALQRLDDPELIAHLGEVLWVSGERDLAMALWDRGLADYPDSQPLIAAWQRLTN